MNKIVMFSKDFQIISVSNGVPEKYEYSLSYVRASGTYYLTSASSPFIVVPETRNIAEITKDEVVLFLLESVLERLKEECEKDLQGGMYSPTTGKHYYYGLYDQLRMTQQLALLGAKESPNLNPEGHEDFIIWKTMEGDFVPHTSQEFYQVCLDAEAHTKKWMGKMWQVEVHLYQTIKEYEQLFTIKSFSEEFQKLLDLQAQAEQPTEEPVEEPVEEPQTPQE